MITKEQLDTIRNAKTKEEVFKAYKAIEKPIWDAFEAKVDTAYKTYESIRKTALETYKVIIEPVQKEIEKWQPPKEKND